MMENYIIFGVGFYFLTLVLSAFLAFFGKSFRKATILFVFSNGAGFLSAILFFLFFSKEVFVFAKFDGFFHFVPRLNFLSALFFSIISGVSCLIGVYSLRYLELYKETYNPRVVQFLMSFFVLGMQGVLLSNTAFSFLFFWEVMSITSFFPFIWVASFYCVQMER